MNNACREAKLLAERLLETLNGLKDREIALCPPFTALETVGRVLKGSSIKWGGQNCFWEKEGAYTGEVSSSMLKDLGCSFVIIGHSERRGYFGETNATVNKKIKAALEYGIAPIVCAGETLAEHQEGRTTNVVGTQLREGLKGICEADLRKMVIAYEPVWAIGTGNNEAPPGANKTINLLRSILAELGGHDAANSIRILYGGSVKPENISSFMSQPEIDGALVGGASLIAEHFINIVNWDKTNVHL